MLLNPPVPLVVRPGYALIAAGAVALLPPWARRSLRLPLYGPGLAVAERAGAGFGGPGAVGDGRTRGASPE